jgi:hypothetical protein
VQTAIPQDYKGLERVSDTELHRHCDQTPLRNITTAFLAFELPWQAFGIWSRGAELMNVGQKVLMLIF